MADRSRTNLSGMSELEAREAEAEEARARLSRTLETLTGPDTREAVKAEVLGHVQSHKDELLKQADRYKDELLRRADEYKGELLARAETYKGEIMDRAEQYKGEFLHRADGYKNEALQRAEEYKNEVMERARESGRRTVRNTAADLKLRAKSNPAAVALIGAGIGWRLYKHPPIATLLVAAGAAMLINTPVRARRSESGSDWHLERETRPQRSMPGQAAGYGSPIDTDVAGSGTSGPMAAMATHPRGGGCAGARLREAAAHSRSGYPAPLCAPGGPWRRRGGRRRPDRRPRRDRRTEPAASRRRGARDRRHGCAPGSQDGDRRSRHPERRGGARPGRPAHRLPDERGGRPWGLGGGLAREPPCPVHQPRFLRVRLAGTVPQQDAGTGRRRGVAISRHGAAGEPRGRCVLATLPAPAWPSVSSSERPRASRLRPTAVEDRSVGRVRATVAAAAAYGGATRHGPFCRRPGDVLGRSRLAGRAGARGAQAEEGHKTAVVVERAEDAAAAQAR